MQRDVSLDCFDCSWNTVEVSGQYNDDLIEYELDCFKGQSQPCGGYTYQRSGHRFILWKVSANHVEFVEYSTQDNLTENALRLVFSHAVVPQVRFVEDFSDQQARLVLFLVTVNNDLYHFTFQHPSMIPKRADSPCSSIFKVYRIQDQMIKLEDVANGSSIRCLDTLSASTIALGCSNGSIYISTLTNGNKLEEIELKPSGMIAKLWQSMKLGFSDESAGSVTSLSAEKLSNQNLILSLCADRKIRVWSTLRKSLIQTIDLPEQEENLRACRLELKSLSTSSTSILVVIRADYEMEAQSNQSEFYLYSFHKGALMYLYRMAPPEIEVVDFGISMTHLWVTGVMGSSLLTQYTRILSENESMSIDSIDAWKSIYSQHYSYLQDDIISPQCIDPADAFLDRLYYPGRFGEKIIAKAMNELFPDIMEQGQSLKCCVFQAMHQKHTEDNDSYLQWKRLLECCEQYWKRDALPIGLFVAPSSSMICVISQEKCFFIRSCSELEEIHRSFVYQEFSSKSQLCIDGLRGLSSIDVDNQLLPLLECAQYLVYACEPGQLFQLDQEILQVKDTGTSFVNAVHSLYHSPQSNNKQDSFSNIFRLFKRIEEPIQLLQAFISFCEENIPTTFDPSTTFDSNTIHISSFSKKLLAASFRQLCEANYKTIRNISLFIFFLAYNKHQLSWSPRDSIQFHSLVIPKLLEITRQYTVFYWLSLQHTAPSATLSEDISDQFSMSLQLQNGTGMQAMRPLMESYFPEIIHIPSVLQASDMSDDEDEVLRGPISGYNMFSSLVPAVETILYRLALTCARLRDCNRPISQSSMEDMASFLDNTNQYLLLQKFIQLQHSQSNQLSYYLGKVYLYLQQQHKASDYFIRASHELEDDEIVSYNEQVASLFAVCAPNQESIDFYERAILHSNDAREKEKLWNCIFKVALMQGDYEQAYNGMIYCGEYQYHNLCEFVRTLCEDARLDLLCYHDQFSFPWSGVTRIPCGATFRIISLVDGVDRILQSLARGTDVLVYPNYYQILFTFHSVRGNYMKAGKAMTDYAYRLGYCSENEMPLVVRLQKQMQCYVAALHVLRLIDENYAWVESTGNYDDLVFPPASPKRRREGEYGYSDHPSMPTPPPQVLKTLQDLKRSYVLTNAQWILAKAGHLVSSTRMSEQDTLTLLINENYIDKAILLAKLSKGDTQTNSMSMIFRKLTKNVLELQFQQTEPVVMQSKWNELKSYLERYDDGDKNKQFYFVVAEEILSTGGNRIPEWIAAELRFDSASLLRLYLSHRLFEEAADVVLYLLTHLNGQETQIWLPYTQIDQLLKCAADDPEIHWDEKLERIRSLIAGYGDVLYSNANIIQEDKSDSMFDDDDFGFE